MSGINCLRILVVMNPVVTAKNGKEHIYWKDSGFIYMKHLISSLPSGYRFYWLVPDTIKKREDKEWFLETNKNIEIVSYPYPSSVVYNRFDFSIKLYDRIFKMKKMDVDVVFNNQPEISLNIMTWFEKKRDIPLFFNFFHWFDCKESAKFKATLPTYFFREYDAVINSDVSFFHNQYALRLFKKEMRRKHIRILKFERERERQMPAKDYSTIVDYFYPPPTKFGTDRMRVPRKTKDKKIILFNHRNNQTTNWLKVIGILKEVYKERQDFVLWMTDDTTEKLVSIKDDLEMSDSLETSTPFIRRFMAEHPFIVNKSAPFAQFGYLIKKSHFAICAHKGYSTWNMAVLDCFYNGCFSLVPYEGVYKYMFKVWGDKYGIFHDHKNLKERIIELLDVDKKTLDRRASNLVKKCRFFNLDQLHIKKHIDNIIEMECSRSAFRDFKEAKQSILEKGYINKLTWSSMMWKTSHSKSYKRMRWQLLSSGEVKDDTTKSETTYYIGRLKKREEEIKNKQGSFMV